MNANGKLIKKYIFLEKTTTQNCCETHDHHLRASRSTSRFPITCNQTGMCAVTGRCHVAPGKGTLGPALLRCIS